MNVKTEARRPQADGVCGVSRFEREGGAEAILHRRSMYAAVERTKEVM